jgi:uncharacterized protein
VIAECDQLAANPYDSTRPKDVLGVYTEEIDAPRALEACTRALNDRPDDARLKYQLGRTDEKAKLYDRALDLCRQAGDRGCALALLELGNAYFWGSLGLAEDDAEAVKFFRKAADLGNALAMSDVAIEIAQGKGIKRDYAEVGRWLGKAADPGEIRALREFYEDVRRGEFVDRDEIDVINGVFKKKSSR